MINKHFLFLITLFVFAACGANKSHFEGSWKNTKTATDKLNISKSGENFKIEIGYLNNGTESWNKFDAVLNKDSDRLEFGDANISGTINFDSKTGHIFSGGGAEFERTK